MTSRRRGDEMDIKYELEKLWIAVNRLIEEVAKLKGEKTEK